MGYLRGAANKGAGIGLGTAGVGVGAVSGLAAIYGASRFGWDEAETVLEGSARGAQMLEEFVLDTDYDEDEYQTFDPSEEVYDNLAATAGSGIVAAAGIMAGGYLWKKAGDYW